MRATQANDTWIHVPRIMQSHQAGTPGQAAPVIGSSNRPAALLLAAASACVQRHQLQPHTPPSAAAKNHFHALPNAHSGSRLQTLSARRRSSAWPRLRAMPQGPPGRAGCSRPELLLLLLRRPVEKAAGPCREGAARALPRPGAASAQPSQRRLHSQPHLTGAEAPGGGPYT